VVAAAKHPDECSARSCTNAMTATCAWRMHVLNEETGERTYTGTVCGMNLCDDHTCMTRGKPLCPWHRKKAEEEGLA
jgi:hypothetical protein